MWGWGAWSSSRAKPVGWHLNCTENGGGQCPPYMRCIMRNLISSLLAGLVIVVLMGCADHPSEVPADGVKVAEGNSKLLYKAPEAGTIFIYESPDNRLVYRGAIRKGDTVELNAKDDRITVNGKTVMEQGI